MMRIQRDHEPRPELEDAARRLFEPLSGQEPSPQASQQNRTRIYAAINGQEATRRGLTRWQRTGAAVASLVVPFAFVGAVAAATGSDATDVISAPASVVGSVTAKLTGNDNSRAVREAILEREGISDGQRRGIENSLAEKPGGAGASGMQGPPDHAGPKENAGPKEGSNAPAHAGPPDHAGPKETKGNPFKLNIGGAGVDDNAAPGNSRGKGKRPTATPEPEAE
jgi:hypothetical protein